MLGRKRSRDSFILEKVVACLTGMPLEDKERLHDLVEAMGGRFTRDLNSMENTHLVASEAVGAKYEAAVRLGTLQIVRPSWIEACWKQQKFVDCCEHFLREPQKKNDICLLSKQPQLLSLEEALNQQLDATSRSDSWLFSACHFCVVGFNDDDAVFAKLARLIRRCMGTIYWENCDQDVITHAIVSNDYMDEATRDAATNRQNGPVFLSPRWVVDSVRDGKLLPFAAHYLPEFRVDVIKAPKVDVEKTGSLVAPPIFRGSIFVLLRVVPPEWAVDFDSKDIENIITQHGGQMLSQVLLNALKADQAAAVAKRTCYSICWGGASTHDLQYLFSQVKRYQLCNVESVTPIWLFTCATEQKYIQPNHLPELFQANNRPIYSFTKKDEKGKAQISVKPLQRISVTGFGGSQRTAIIHLITAMGGIYDDSMRTSTTHLICCEAGVGQKYEKAVEWKLHIVSVSWLYHVACHGFDGELTTEERFAIAPPASDQLHNK